MEKFKWVQDNLKYNAKTGIQMSLLFNECFISGTGKKQCLTQHSAL